MVLCPKQDSNLGLSERSLLIELGNIAVLDSHYGWSIERVINPPKNYVLI